MATRTVESSVAAGSIQLSNVRIGIQGNFQVGRWTAIEADLESDAWPVTFSVVVPDPDGNLTRQPSVAISEPKTGPARVRTLFRTGRLTDNDDSAKSLGFGGLLQVEVLSPDGIETFHLVSSPTTVESQVEVPSLKDAWTQKTRFWAVLGEAEGFESAAQRIIDRERSGLRLPVHLIDLEEAAALPTAAGALESLDTLIVTGAQQIPPSTDEAIRQWVQSGGHLVLTVATPDDYAALPMSEWIPIRVTGQSRLRDLSNLTTQLPGSVAIRVDVVNALQMEFDHGESIATTIDGPLWVRVPYGFGSISVLGVDVSRRPLVNWESLPALCERLTGTRPTAEKKRERSATAQLSQTGVSELQTQLVMGLDQFTGVQKPTSWMAMGLILLYLLVIGPIDYLIVHKLLKRPTWTWVTLPVLVVAAAGTTIVLARDRNPQQVLANQIDVIDFDATSGLARVHSWMSFTSPSTSRYRVNAEMTADLIPGAQPPMQPRISWAGIPETGFRGMYRTGGLDQWKPAYSINSQGGEIPDLPVTIWSSANTVAEWNGAVSGIEHLVDADLTSSGGQLSGTLTNRMSAPLSDWLVAHEGRVYLPQTRTSGAAALRIAPGETLDFNVGRRVVANVKPVVPRVLQSYLTGVRRTQIDRGDDRTGSDVVAGRATYDPLERDPYHVLQMVTFYEAARGDEFTSLENHTLDGMDLSSLLPLDRAVLFCRLESPATQFSINDTSVAVSEHDTILRIVLPVESR